MRVSHQAAFMLHARPWSETSLLVDMFTPQYGRFRLMAKGARRQKTGQRAILQAFQPLIISWSGKSSLVTLTQVEARQRYPRLQGQALASAYYMSELLFKFLHAHDAHENLFNAYEKGIKCLSEADEAQSVLRAFECSLLSEIGYGLALTHDVESRQPIKAKAYYFYYPERGPVKTQYEHDETGLVISGETLIALGKQEFQKPVIQKQAKQLLRTLLARQSKGRAFQSREVYRQILKSHK